jgi:hypothetical protein
VRAPIKAVIVIEIEIVKVPREVVGVPIKKKKS